MSPKEIFSQLSSWILNFIFNLKPFYLYFILFFMCGSVFWIRVLNTDPDPVLKLIVLDWHCQFVWVFLGNGSGYEVFIYWIPAVPKACWYTISINLFHIENAQKIVHLTQNSFILITGDCQIITLTLHAHGVSISLKKIRAGHATIF